MDFSGSDIVKLESVARDYQLKINEIEPSESDKYRFINDKVEKFKQTAVGTLDELSKQEKEIRKKAYEEYIESIKPIEEEIKKLNEEKEQEMFKNSCWANEKNGKEVFLWLWHEAKRKADESYDSSDYPDDEYYFYEELENDFLEGLSIFLGKDSKN